MTPSHEPSSTRESSNTLSIATAADHDRSNR